MVMHKGSGYEYGISEMIKSYLKNENFNFVNRIDKATSGLIICLLYTSPSPRD